MVSVFEPLLSRFSTDIDDDIVAWIVATGRRMGIELVKGDPLPGRRFVEFSQSPRYGVLVAEFGGSRVEFASGAAYTVEAVIRLAETYRGEDIL